MAQPTSCRPYGDPVTSDLWFVGHDPRLRRSTAEAACCFFLDLLDRPPSTSPGEREKRALAQAVRDYIDHLAGRDVLPERIYVTNLCNEFLPRAANGTVLIPEPAADRGLRAIIAALAQRTAPPRVLIATSQQVLYHTVRGGFLDEHGDLAAFASASKPRRAAADEGRYEPTRGEAFLAVCGRVFAAAGVPVVPVLHVKQWKRWSPRYDEPMKSAAEAVWRLMA